MKRAGFILVVSDAGEVPRSLPAVSDFTTGVWGSAYWRGRSDGASWVYRASGSQVLLDVRTELGLGADSRRIWTPAVATALLARLRTAGVSVVGLPPVTTGVVLPFEVLRLALWLTYDGSNPVGAFQLPFIAHLPVVGAELPVSDGRRTTMIRLDPSDLAVDPFTRGTVDPIDVATSRRRKRGRGVFVMAALAAAVLLSPKGGV